MEGSDAQKSRLDLEGEQNVIPNKFSKERTRPSL